MKQAGTVIRVRPDGLADIAFARPSACGSNCASCHACVNSSPHIVQAVVPFPVSAGDRVFMQVPGRLLLGRLFLFFLLPILLFFSVWLLATLLHARNPALWGAAPFALGLALAVWRSRKRPLALQVTPFFEED